MISNNKANAILSQKKEEEVSPFNSVEKNPSNWAIESIEGGVVTATNITSNRKYVGSKDKFVELLRG